AIRWVERARKTGSAAPGQMGGHKPKAIAGEHRTWLLVRVTERDFTIRGLVAEFAERGLKVDYRSVWNFVHTEKLSFKKSVVASERDRPDVARRRRQWIEYQNRIAAERLVFIDESVLQSTGRGRPGLRPFVKLRGRWGRTPRDWLSGAGLNPVRAAAVKSRGGERRIKSSDQTEQVSVRKTNESEPSEDASL